MADANALFRQKLQDSGLSTTVPRTAVFEALYQNGHEPMTMKQLVDATKRHADRASIYRTVKSLETVGIVSRLHIGWKYKLELSEDFHGHHHHLSCIKCGATHATHDDEEFELLLTQLAAKHGYSITDHQLDIKGFCKNCSNK